MITWGISTSRRKTSTLSRYLTAKNVETPTVFRTSSTCALWANSWVLAYKLNFNIQSFRFGFFYLFKTLLFLFFNVFYWPEHSVVVHCDNLLDGGLSIFGFTCDYYAAIAFFKHSPFIFFSDIYVHHTSFAAQGSN